MLLLLLWNKILFENMLKRSRIFLKQKKLSLLRMLAYLKIVNVDSSITTASKNMNYGQFGSSNYSYNQRQITVSSKATTAPLRKDLD